jgi:hypothetical protein
VHAPVAPLLPATGAADVFVADVVYGIEGEHHRYLFSVEYTLGLVHAKHRIVRAASFREPKDRADPQRGSPLELVEQPMPLVEQYRTLHARHAEEGVSGQPSVGSGQCAEPLTTDH